MSTPPKPPPVKPPSPPGPPKPAGRPAAPPPTAAAPKAPTRAPKTFAISEYSGAGEGEKVIIYAGSGMGKTTLASMAPKPVFLPLDDGSRKIRDPRDGSVLRAVTGLASAQDVRDALHQANLFDDAESIVIDTGTVLEAWADQLIFDNYTVDGKRVSNIEAFGFGKGYRHALEVYRLFLQDLDVHLRRGKNVILLCQENAVAMANAEGLDFIQAGPKLYHNKQCSTRLEVCEWADHVLRIGYSETNVVATGPKSNKGKIVGNNTTRVIFSEGARHFAAKSRPINGVRLPPVISFNPDENGVPNDDSLWQFMFPPKE